MFRIRHLLLQLAGWQKILALFFLLFLVNEVYRDRYFSSDVGMIYRYDVKLGIILCLFLCVVLNRKYVRLFLVAMIVYCCCLQLVYLFKPIVQFALTRF